SVTRSAMEEQEVNATLNSICQHDEFNVNLSSNSFHYDDNCSPLSSAAVSTSTYMKSIVLFITSAIILIGLFGNSLVCYIASMRPLKSPVNIYIVNMAFS